MKTILVPIDFSCLSERQIETAVTMAKSFSAEIYLLHVVPPDPAFISYQAGPETVRKNIADIYTGEHQRLQSISSKLCSQGVHATALLVQGPIADKILEIAEKIQADIIISGSHGHGSIHNIILGSISAALLQKARCPMLILPVHLFKDEANSKSGI